MPTIPAGPSRIKRQCRTGMLLGILALTGLIPLLGLISPASAVASAKQISIIDDQNLDEATASLQEMRHLGTGMVRYVVHWSDIAPNSSSTQRPSFNANDPAAYPAANWLHLDTVLRTASADGIKVLLTVAGHVPAWANGPGKPPDPNNSLGAWKPSASEFGQFVRALGTRYSGHYRGLPAVRAWEIYNEPNFGEDLSPQSVGPVLTGADMYRSMVASSWSALQATGHGHDTVVIGVMAARGFNHPNVFGDTTPLQFVREMYCVDDRYRPFRGHAAAQRGCPTTAAAARSFRRRNPGLFNSTAWSDHPYPLSEDMTVPPNRTRNGNRNNVPFVWIPNLEKAIDKSVKIYGSRKHYPVWNTEYGYISKPPRTDGVSLANQGYYLNWAEYLSWKDPRIGSWMQYLLTDPDPNEGVVRCGGFASGLIFSPAPPTIGGCAPGTVPGAAKPALDAWRLPLYLPQTSGRRGRSLEVWGCVRPAPFAFRDTHRAQAASILFRPTGKPTFSTLRTIRKTSGSCYFDLKLKFPSSGTVELTYRYPATDRGLFPAYGLPYYDPLATKVSRQINVTIH